MFKKLHNELFQEACRVLVQEKGQSQRAVTRDTAELTGKSVYNMYDFVKGNTQPTHETWERLHAVYPDVFPEPIYTDDSGKTYALREVNVKGHTVKVKGNNNKIKTSVQKTSIG
jgi:hypothetical protein